MLQRSIFVRVHYYVFRDSCVSVYLRLFSGKGCFEYDRFSEINFWNLRLRSHVVFAFAVTIVAVALCICVCGHNNCACGLDFQKIEFSFSTQIKTPLTTEYTRKEPNTNYV